MHDGRSTPPAAATAGPADEAAGPAFFSGLPGPTRFIIARHGQSEGNARRIIQGTLDLPLDEAGKAQARALGAWLAGEGLDSVLSSPLARAAETAAIVARAAGLPAPEPSPLLRELDAGIFTGLSLPEAAELHPEATASFERRSWDGVPGAESSVDLYARALSAWRLLRERASEPAAGGRGRAAAGPEGQAPAGKGGGNAAAPRCILALSHGGFIQWLLRSSFGCRSWMPLFTTGNCGVFELFVEPLGPGEPAYLIWRKIDWRAPDAAPRIEQVF
jgi:broad specificity phosphatase PhoE